MAKRINTSLKETDKFGAGKHGWTDGVSPPDDSTSGEDSWFDHAQEEIATVVESLGYTIPAAEVIANRNMMQSALHIAQLSTMFTAFKEYTGLDVAVVKVFGGLVTKTANEAFDHTIITRIVAGTGVVQWEQLTGIDSTTAPGGNSVRAGVWSQADAQNVLVGTAGDAWTQAVAATPVLRTTPNANALLAVADNGTLYVAGGDSGDIITSPDGITWTARTSNLSGSINNIEWNGTIFLATDDTVLGDASTSTDGITWVNKTVTGLPTDTSFHKLLWNTQRAKWYATAFDASSTPRDNTILVSTDGETWTTEKALVDGNDPITSFNVSPSGIMILTMQQEAGPIVSDGRHPWRRLNTTLRVENVGFAGTQMAFTTSSSLAVCGELL